MAVWLVSSSCYSEVIGEQTNNVTGTQPWDMTTILPQEWPGLTVNGVFYRYDAVKETPDDFTVSIQNKNALGNGYIWQQTDDWSGLPGTTIQKNLVVPDILVDYWGEGSISTTGTGTVENSFVSYIYRYDTCFDPLNDPTCPGYEAARMKWLEDNMFYGPDGYDPLTDEVLGALPDEIDPDEIEESNPDEPTEEEKEKALEELGNALATADAAAKMAELVALNNIPQFNAYYKEMQGGYYPDTQAYVSTQLPENKQGLRVGLAQQILMEKMIDEQYKNKGERNVQ